MKTLFLLLTVVTTYSQQISLDLTTNQVAKVRQIVDVINYDRTNAVPPLPSLGYRQWLTNQMDLMLDREVGVSTFNEADRLNQRFRVATPAQQQQVRDVLKP